MHLYGLIGNKLSHSFSPTYFSRKFNKQNIDAEYHLFEMETAEGIMKLIESIPNLKGLNVTIPFKTEVMQYLDEIDAVAHDVGSVNTISVNRQDEKAILKGYNTDVLGFESSLLGFLQDKQPREALVLGTGGSALAVEYVLKKLGIKVLFVSRFPGQEGVLSYADIDKAIIRRVKLIINTTPVGMYPDVDHRPDIAYKYLTPEHSLFDLIYNPGITQFMRQGSHYGANVMNGLEMLEIQAEESWKIWQES